ncbi:MAG: hypothetical protein K2P64_02720 [Lachnospiraceae bacterium]|nr:hypothetical protein [Lachnospiraceae bacterium]
MIKEWRDFWETLKRERILIGMSFVGMLLALGFWGVAFPQYLFTDDCVKLFWADGQEVTEEEREEENLYYRIGTAKQEQIEVKISILEWAER